MDAGPMHACQTLELIVGSLTHVLEWVRRREVKARDDTDVNPRIALSPKHC